MIRGTKRPLEKKLDLRASIHNRFDVEVIDAATGEVKQKARAFNLICDALWTRLLYASSGGSWIPLTFATYVLFGSGSGTPSASDTALFSLLGARSYSGTLAGDVADGVVYRQGFITLQAEEYVGATLTEVGVGYDSTHITTHALLEDMNGNPINIEKSATDVIRIYATIYVHFSAGGWYGGAVSVLPFSGDDYVFFTTLTGASPGTNSVNHPVRFSGAGTRTGDFAGLSSDISAMVDTVDAAAKKVSASFRIPAGSLNFPIRALRVTFQLHVGSYTDRYERLLCFTPGAWAPTAEIRAEPCGTGDGSAVGFSTAFPVKTGGNVYVDGVQASGVTVRPGPADGATLERWMNRVQKRSAAGTPVYEQEAYSYSDTSGLSFPTLSAGAGTSPLENPFYALGVAKVRFYASDNNTQAEVFASDDLETWTSAGTISLSYHSWAELTIPAALRTKRYWRINNAGQTSFSFRGRFVADVADTAHNIVFTTPPAAGAVITCDYTPDCIPKDANHVFDLTLELSFGEYSEA